MNLPAAEAWMRRELVGGLWLVLILSLGLPLLGQTAPPPEAVAARVNGREIRWGDVERELRSAIRELDVAPDAMTRLRLETRDKLIDRHLVLAYLEQHELAASADDVELAWKRLASELKGRGRTMTDYSHQLGQTAEELRESMRWSLSWKKFLDRFLTDANVEKYYGSHRRDFDGTELRVAHLLLKTDRPDDVAPAVARLEELRRQIVDGKLTFADAARQFSAAPTAEDGGQLGWISRHQPMPESFNRAAFATAVGDVSPPVVTPFGVHLITCLEERQGQKTWQQARGELEKAMTAYLFTWSADQQRPSAKIERLDLTAGGGVGP